MEIQSHGFLCWAYYWQHSLSAHHCAFCLKRLLLQDTTLANKAAWDSLGRSPAFQDDDGQQGAEEEEGNGDGLWNNFQSQDDAEREKVSR